MRLKNISLNILLMATFCLMFICTSCVYTPVKGSGEKKEIESHYLKFWYNRQILPAFQHYLQEATRMAEVSEQVVQANNNEQLAHALEEMRTQFKQSALVLQDVILFDQQLFREKQSSLYEVAQLTLAQPAQIRENIEQHLTAEQLRKRIELTYQQGTSGYSTLDYMLYSGEVEMTPAARQYMHSVCKLQLQYATEAYQYYKSQAEPFVQNTDFSMSGSVSLVFNTLMRQYETFIRNQKVGIPVGFYGAGVLQHHPAPKAVECYYEGHGLSTALLRRSLTALHNFYEGVPYGGEAAQPEQSLKRFINDNLSASQREEITGKLQQAINTTVTQTGELHGDLAEIISNQEGLTKLRKQIYPDLQRIVGIVKSQVITAMGLTITYTDGEEGD